MSPNGADRGYAIARSTLIEALRALAPLSPEGFILVGAHAVYLRAPEIIASIAPFTLDGDLVADPRKIGRARLIRDRLEGAGFELRGRAPGLYSDTAAPSDEQYAARVDILVPSGVAHLWEAEGYSARDASATMALPGLEVTLVDHSPMLLAPIGVRRNTEPVTVEVAGIVALLVAKAWKIWERHEQGEEAFREVGKDVTDVYRLLRASRADELQATLRNLSHDARVASIARDGATHLRSLCIDDGPAIELVRELLGASQEAEIITASLAALVEEFHGLVEQSL